MKILLINPPSDNEIIANNPAIIEEERGFNPPLGLLYIAAYIERHSNFDVEVLDTQVLDIGYNKLKEVIEEKSPDVVGITAMTFTLIDVIKTADIVKEIDRDIKVVLGGPHVHIYPYETIKLPQVDFIVLGEGEVTFLELVKNISNKNILREIKGVIFKENGDIINTGIRKLNNNLDDLPFPARHLTPIERYSSLMAKRNPITTMFTSRGCPFRCSFCDRPHLGKEFRARSAKNVVDEMDECVDMGIREFLIYDDTFTIDKKRVLDICDEIIKRKLNIGWDFRAHINTMDEEMLERLKEANCERIHFGVESGVDRILKILRKGITTERVKSVFKITKDFGISTLAYFMIGAPTETKDDILRTIEFAKEIDPDFVHITIFTPFPGTEVYRIGLENGIIKRDYWKDFANNPSDDFEPPYWYENLNKDELKSLIIHAYKEFYTRPAYIIKRLLKVRSLSEFKRKIKAGVKVLRMDSP